jgi:hypothetical protein
MATILSVDAVHDDGKFPPLTSEQGDHITALLRTPVIGLFVSERGAPL